MSEGLAKYSAKKDGPKCPICSHEQREGIEMLGIISCATWSICANQINKAFGTMFSSKTVEKHMTEHRLHQTSVESGVILDGLEGRGAKISPKSMLQTLLVQGMMDLSKGKIRCKTPSELLSVINMIMQIQKQEDMEAAAVEGLDIGAIYSIMGAYGEAIKDTVSPQQLREIVSKATAMGSGVNITNIEYVPPQGYNEEDLLELAVQDYKTLGRGRTREELVEAGVIDEAFEGLETPNP